MCPFCEMSDCICAPHSAIERRKKQEQIDNETVSCNMPACSWTGPRKEVTYDNAGDRVCPNH